MLMLPLTLGFTQRDPASDYRPVLDGYRPGAVQVTLTIGPVPIPGHPEDTPLSAADAEMVAQAAWEAMNAPEGVPLNVVAKKIRAALAEAFGTLRATQPVVYGQIHALGIGDTVTVGGHTLVCGRFDWTHLPAQ